MNLEHILQNSYFIIVLSIFLIVYGPKLHQRLPQSLRNLFNNRVFKILVIFLVVHLSGKNLALALTIAIIFLVTVDSVGYVDAVEKFYGAPVSRCKNYENKEVGTAFYPLNDTNDQLEHRDCNTGPYSSNVGEQKFNPTYAA